MCFMQNVYFYRVCFCFFVRFINLLHYVHKLFIITCYSINKINLIFAKYVSDFFIIAQMPKGVWALLIYEAYLSVLCLADRQNLFVQGKHPGIQIRYHLGTLD